MRYRVFSLLVLAWLALYASAVPAALLAQSNELPIVYHAAIPLLPPAVFGSTDRVTVMIELADPPAIAGSDGAQGVVGRSARNRAAQERMLPMLASFDAQVLFRTSLVYNGIAVSIPAARLTELTNLRNVVGMHIIPPKQMADVQVGPAAVAAAIPWNSPLGATGQNVRVGVIDTGIDYTHATFGGPGTAAAYQAINPAQPATGIFPNVKVAGGYDFAGNSYDATGATGSPVPQPDPNPLDCNGHGTRVASVLAGYGVTSQRKTYTGSYASPLDVQYFKVAPGIAPRASLYALKIFGCSGASTLLTQAVEWALDPNGDGNPSDRLDVLNISLGTPFGSNDDPDAVAINNAVAAGLLVVSSAGDVGGTFFAITSPGSAQRAITVGASTSTVAASMNTQPPAGVLPTSARGPQRGGTTLKPDLLAPGNGIASAQVASGSSAVAGSGPDIAVPQVTGAVALLRQLYPTWTALQIKSALLNTATPVQTDGVPAPPSLSGAGELNVLRLAGIDFLAYSRESDGGLAFGVTPLTQPTTLEQSVTLENMSDKERMLAVAASAVVTETGVLVEVPGTITVPPHSTVDVPVRAAIDPSALRHTPDAATPLLQSELPRYFLAEHGGAVNITATIGTRLRVGHVADLPPVAFYLDENLITGSIRTDNVGDFVAVPAGTHTMRVVRADQPPTAPPIVAQTISLQPDQDYTFILVGREKVFGLDVINNTPDAPPPANTALLQLTNANIAVDVHSGPFDVYLDGTLAAAALAASASTSFIPIAPGKHVVTFYPAGKAPIFNNLNAIEEFDAQPGELLLVRTDRQGDEYNCPDRNRLCQAQQRGGLTRAPIRTPSVAAHVAYNVFPASASASRAAQTVVNVSPGSHTFTLPLQNTGARNSDLMPTGYPGAQTPLVSAFALEATSPPNETLPEHLRAADVQYVGVSNSYSVTGALNNTDLFFGTSSYGAWATPHEVQMRVYLDVNNDGNDDFVLLNTDYGSAVGQAPNDVFINAVYRIQPDGTLLGLTTFSLWGTFPAPSAPQDGVDVAAFDTSVMFLTVNTQSLGLAAGQTQLSYHVETRARDANGFGTVVDRVPAAGSLTYDIAHAAVVPINTAGLLRQRPLFVDTATGSISGLLEVHSGQQVAQGMLLLHHHNLASAQAEVVEIRRPASLELIPRLYVPFAALQSP